METKKAKKYKLKRGNKVIVIAGNFKGLETEIISIDREKGRVKLSGITVKKHVKPSAKYPRGGIITINSSIDVSNVMLLGSNKKPTKIGIKLNQDGKRQKYEKKTGKLIAD